MFNNDTTKIKSSKIIGVQFSVLSPNDIRKGSVAEINTRDTYINNKPVLNGLFDPRMGVIEAGLICPTDGLDYIQTPGYFGHIELARPVFYIQYINTLIKILRCICIKCGKLKLSKKKYDFLLNKSPKKRWDFVFSHSSKIKRCGAETEDGCGCKQPKKIYKQDLSEIYAEWENTSGIKNNEGDVNNKPTIKLTAETVLRIFKRITNEDITFMGFSPVWSRPEWFICQVLAVPPPAVRPSVKHDSQQRSEDDISHIIVNIIKANKTLQEKIQQGAPAKVIEPWTTVLQYYIATMIDNKIPGCCPVAQRSGRALKSIKERLVGKQGRVRGNLQGKRVDFSARSVISPDANISIKELGVPLKIAKNITFPNKVNKRNKKYLTKLVLNGPENYPGANILERKNGDSISLRYVNRETLELYEGDVVHRHLIDGDPVLFNRQPTLHRMSMMCHIVKVMKVGDTFRMNVGDTKPYNADFDGDEMNMHGPQSEMAQCELLELAAVPYQIISPANNQSIVGIFQDSLLGCYRFTRKDIVFNERTAMNLLMYNKNIDLNIFKKASIDSFDLLSQILPAINCKFPNKQFSSDEDRKTSNKIIEIINGKYKRGQIDKGVLGGKSTGLILSIFNDYDHKHATSFIDELQSIVTEYMKLSSYSVGIHDLIANDETNDKIYNAVLKNKEKVKKIENQLHFDVFENNSGKTNNIEFETQVNSILNKAQEEAGKIGRKSLNSDNRFVIMVNAGSKGNNINIVQMISCLGQQNVDGKRIPYGFDDRTLPHYTKYDDSPEARGFVENSFIQGLTPEELYFHAMGGRTGLIDTAVKTSSTGYIQRRLIKSLEDLCVKYDMSVRNNKNKIIQFKYGTDCINTMKVENIKLPIVSMSTEEIYSHFQIPNSKDIKNFMISNYNKDTQKRFKKQKKDLIKKTKNILKMMMKKRDEIAKHVFNNEDNINIYIPVNFYRLINNVQNNLFITNNNIVDITPLELYNLIEEKLKNMSNNIYVQPSELFKVAWYYYLSPKDLLTIRRFNKKAVIHLLNILEFNYKKSIVNPGEMVGMVAAQSIGEPTTQMTLNTFHFAGVASKSNVTRGVPRIEEILTLSENPKNPSITIKLKAEDETKLEKAQEIKYNLEYTNLRDITEVVSICFDPNLNSTNISEDEKIIEEYLEFEKMMEDCGVDNEYSENDKFSKWIIRFELSKENMLEKNISMDDIHFAIKNSLKNKIHCVYSDFNNDNLIFRIRGINLSNNKKKTLDQGDEIHILKNLQNNILNNIILRGIKKIPKIIIRKVTNELTLKNGNYVKEEKWVLDTVGTNLIDVLAVEEIDSNNTITNDIQEVYRTLGIEAARQAILNELQEAISFDGTYIDDHHLTMLADRITATKKMVSVFRHGINNDDIGPIAKASFEETPEMFLRAARHAELDLMTGVSANVMVGQEGYFGTGSFQILLNLKSLLSETSKIKEKQLEKEENIDEQLIIDSVNDPCSKEKIIIESNIEDDNVINSGNIADDYQIDF
uniref:DNA-directed RNA polymerase n=1 Tax=viral metagenome TaxID=1070528 RepID=A0A6C0FAB7_9ZZZZ|tara:strand:+ start:8028 stop:12539 length:4512 start_codon:yes stop_codon:yes gene_type:complete